MKHVSTGRVGVIIESTVCDAIEQPSVTIKFGDGSTERGNSNGFSNPTDEEFLAYRESL